MQKGTENRKRKVREEDWVCSDPLCGNINYYFRLNCNRCRTGRDEYVPPLVKVIGRKAAAKSHGIFKGQNWQCACGNVNWASRQKCNRCNTDKFDENNIMIGGHESLADDDDEEKLMGEPVPGTSGVSGNSAKMTGIPSRKTKKIKRADDQSQRDWLCKICGDVSWPRKGACELCHVVTSDIPTGEIEDYYDTLTDDDDSGNEVNKASRNQSDELRQDLQEVEDAEKTPEEQMITGFYLWLSEFVDRDSILNGIVPNDRRTFEDILLALILGNLATSENMPEPRWLDTLNSEEKLRLFLRRCDPPEDVRRVLPHVSLREMRESLLQSLISSLLKMSSELRGSW